MPPNYDLILNFLCKHQLLNLELGLQCVGSPVDRHILKREAKDTLRHHLWDSQPRTQPLPSLPDGVNHKLSKNYYCSRDGRREAKPDLVLIEGSSKKLISEKSASVSQDKPAVARTPGQTYAWDTPMQ